MPLAKDGYGFLPVVDVDADLDKGFSCGKEHLDRFLVTAPSFHGSRVGFTLCAS